MINGMPSHAQAPIKNYLETGNFKDHQKIPMPNDESTRDAAKDMKQTMDAFVASDNTAADSDKRPGRITSEDGFFGPLTGGFEHSGDGKTTESFVIIGGQDGAVLYSRNSPSGLDVITVGSFDGSDGVMHFSSDPDGHFMTMAG